MTKTLLFAGALLWLAASTPAAPLQLDSLTVGSVTYRNVTVLGANATDLYFTHARGIANVKLKYLSRELQKKFNYDPRVAAEVERKQSENDTLYQNSLASSASAQAERNVRTAQKKAASTEDSLADPVSDKSLLGKTGPSVEVEKWLSEKPGMTGKAVLISFWAPWSLPCRKCVPDLNALQKKFGDKLVVVGVSSDPETDTLAAEPKLDFPSAIDTPNKLAAAVGVTSIPCVLLMDANRVVRYQGHPGAITEKKLQAVLATTP